MKNFKTFLKLAFLAITVFFVNTQTAYGQAIQPDLNAVDPIVKGLIVKYQIKVTTGDTVHSRIELSPTSTFPFPQVFYLRTSDTTTSFIDTITEAMGIAPAPAKYYVRIWSISKHGNDSLVSSVDVETSLEPVQAPALTVIQVLPNKDGAYFTLNAFSGNTTEKMSVSYKFSYDSSNFFPGGQREFTGTVNSFQDSVWGMFSNKDTWIWIKYQNSVNSGDTVVFFRTTLQPQKAVLTLQKTTAATDSIKITADVATFNVSNRVVAYWNSGNDSIEIGSFKSLKAEPFNVTITGLPANTTVSGTIKAYSQYGVASINWSSKTLEAPVTPGITITSVAAFPGKAEIQRTWKTNSGNLIIREDAKIYTDSTESNPAQVMQLSNGSPNISGSAKNTVEIEPGTYWIRITAETEKGDFIKSNLYMFTISFGLSVQPLTTATQPVECKMFDINGKELGTMVYSGNFAKAIPQNYWNQIILLRSVNGMYMQKIQVIH